MTANAFDEDRKERKNWNDKSFLYVDLFET